MNTDGGNVQFNGYTHDSRRRLHAIVEYSNDRLVLLAGSGDDFMDAIHPEGLDFFTPLGHDKIFREVGKVLSNLLDIEAPVIAALNGCLRSRPPAQAGT